MSTIQGAVPQPALNSPPWEVQDSVGLKILSSIPVIGFIANGVIDYQLKSKYETLQQGENVRAINIIKIANQYNAIRIARTVAVVIAIAACIAMFALNVFTLMLPLISTAVLFLGTVAIKAFHIHKNKQMIRDINQNGFKGHEKQYLYL